MTSRFGTKVINPEDPGGPKITVWFHGSLSLGMFKNESTNYWNLITAKYTLENPLAIFDGIRDYEKHGWCYVSRPKLWYVRPEVQKPFPDDLVFLVFVAKTKYVYHFRAEYQDDFNQDLPVDWESRFGKRVWPPTS